MDNYRDVFESKISAGATEKLPYSEKLGANISSWSYAVEGHAKKCVERYGEPANKTTNNNTKSQYHALTTTNSKKKKWDLSENSIVHLARIGRPDILWSVNKFARAVTKWTNVWRV